MSSKDDFSSTNSDMTSEDSESSLEVMGVTLAQPIHNERGASESQLQSMLSKDLEEDEKKPTTFHPFISNYDHIIGVSVIQHHI